MCGQICAHFCAHCAKHGKDPAAPCMGRQRSHDHQPEALRALIKTEHGFGWSIREHRGKVQLTRRFEDGTHSAVSLDLPWDASCQTGVVNAVGEIRQRMDAHGLGLAEAYGLIHSAPTAETGRLDWEAVVQKFLLSREGRRAAARHVSRH